MSILDDYFGTYGMPALQQWQGEDVVYVEGNKQTPCKAIVGVERTIEKQAEDGTKKVLSREVTFAKAQVSPQIKAFVRIGNKPWSIIEHVNENEIHCCVRCERELIHERTRQGFRGGR